MGLRTSHSRLRTLPRLANLANRRSEFKYPFGASVIKGKEQQGHSSRLKEFVRIRSKQRAALSFSWRNLCTKRRGPDEISRAWGTHPGAALKEASLQAIPFGSCPKLGNSLGLFIYKNHLVASKDRQALNSSDVNGLRDPPESGGLRLPEPSESQSRRFFGLA